MFHATGTSGMHRNERRTLCRWYFSPTTEAETIECESCGCLLEARKRVFSHVWMVTFTCVKGQWKRKTEHPPLTLVPCCKVCNNTHNEVPFIQRTKTTYQLGSLAVPDALDFAADIKAKIDRAMPLLQSS